MNFLLGSKAAPSPVTPPAVSLASAQAGPLRPISFDAGINSSTVWTEHLERDSLIEASTGAAASGSLSDEEAELDTDSFDPEVQKVERQKGRPARALYAFEGKPEFREIVVEAGAALEVLREEMQDGWSLVRCGKEVGLLPQSYYTFTSEFARSPDSEYPASAFHLRKASASPTASTNTSPKSTKSKASFLIPQNTGEWIRLFPSFRQSLLGGKSLNRFSNFVTSGAEDWVLNGSAVDPSSSFVSAASSSSPSGHGRDATSASVIMDDNRRLSMLVGAGGEADQHFVEAGPSWRSKVPAFRVLVHSPSKRASTLSGAYVAYSVTSLFHLPPEEDPSESNGHSDVDESGSDRTASPPPSPTRITVHRRFSHFVALHTALTRRLPGIALPPLPDKQYAGRFSADFVEARRGDLERYINRLTRHPVARYAEVLMFFLSCEDDSEWKKLLPRHLSLAPAGPSFYARVLHPHFNVDAEDAEDAVDRFDAHTRAVGEGVQRLRNVFGRVREARVEMSRAERLLSYSLLSIITSRPLASANASTPHEGDREEPASNGRAKGLMTEDGAWCWREGCEDCLKLTKGMQRAADTLQSVADLYDDHARRTQLATHEGLKSVAHPSPMYAPIVDTHRSALSRYTEAVDAGRPDEDVPARCETVLNTTMAEMDTYHTQKVEDFEALTKEHLDGEIGFYEQVLTRLRAARESFDSPTYDALGVSPRQASMYERELGKPRLNPPALSQPCPHVWDAQPMRPVSVAIQEGVGMLLPGRAGVLAKIW